MNQLDEMRKKTNLLQGEDEGMQVDHWKTKCDKLTQQLGNLQEEHRSLLGFLDDLQVKLGTPMQQPINSTPGMHSRSPSDVLNPIGKMSHEMSIQKDDLSTNMSDELMKKKMGKNLATFTQIPRLLNGQINATSQQS
jgi:hypothetical protein